MGNEAFLLYLAVQSVGNTMKIRESEGEILLSGLTKALSFIHAMHMMWTEPPGQEKDRGDGVFLDN